MGRVSVHAGVEEGLLPSEDQPEWKTGGGGTEVGRDEVREGGKERERRTEGGKESEGGRER